MCGQTVTTAETVGGVLELTQDLDSLFVRAAKGLRPAFGVEVEDLGPLRVVGLVLLHGQSPRVALVALEVPGVVEDIAEQGLHLGLTAGHDLAQEIAGVPVHEDPAQIEDDGVHALMLARMHRTLGVMRQVYLAATGRNRGGRQGLFPI